MSAPRIQAVQTPRAAALQRTPQLDLLSPEAPFRLIETIGITEAQKRAKQIDALRAEANLPPIALHQVNVAHQALQDDATDISFLHHSFCSVGLPLRNQDKKDLKMWSRFDGDFSLTITPSFTTLPDGTKLHVGIPFGPKARLISLYLATAVKEPGRDPNDPYVHFGNIAAWFARMNIKLTGGEKGSITAVKEQLLRLTFANWSMWKRHPRTATTAEAGNKSRPTDVILQSERIIEAAIFDNDMLTAYARGEVSKVPWPETVALTQKALDRFRSQSVPVSTPRLQQLTRSASAMDLFLFLSYRLWRIPKGKVVTIPWQQLANQFGEHREDNEYRREFRRALCLALAAYPEATSSVEIDDLYGLSLRYADPAVPRPLMVAVDNTRNQITTNDAARSSPPAGVSPTPSNTRSPSTAPRAKMQPRSKVLVAKPNGQFTLFEPK